MFWLSPIRVWSITPVLELEMLPVNRVCAEDQPLGLVGSLEVRYMKGAEPHSDASTPIFFGAK